MKRAYRPRHRADVLVNTSSAKLSFAPRHCAGGSYPLPKARRWPAIGGRAS